MFLTKRSKGGIITNITIMVLYNFGNILKKKKQVSSISTYLPARKKIKATLPQLLNNEVLIIILAKEYMYETEVFGRLKENKTRKKFLKIAFKTIQYRHDLVYNDILAKTFNGVKTFITINTQMHKIFRKVKKAKPLSIFKLKFKIIQALTPKLKEFYNLTGHTVGYNIYQFFDNKKYHYTHNLKNFGASRKAVFVTMLNEITTGVLRLSDSSMMKQKWKKAKMRLRVLGFKFKISHPLWRVRFRYHRLTEYQKRIHVRLTLRHKWKYFIRVFNYFKKHINLS